MRSSMVVLGMFLLFSPVTSRFLYEMRSPGCATAAPLPANTVSDIPSGTFIGASLTIESDSLLLWSDVPVLAIQFTLTGAGMPGLRFMPSTILSSFQISTNLKNDTDYICLIHTFATTPIPAGRHALGVFTGFLHGMRLRDITVSDPQGGRIPLSVESIESEAADIDVILFPSPGRNTVSARITMFRENDIALEIRDGSGRSVFSQSHCRLSIGTHEIRWDGRNPRGVDVSPGLYFLLLLYDRVVISRSFILLR